MFHLFIQKILSYLINQRSETHPFVQVLTNEELNASATQILRPLGKHL